MNITSSVSVDYWDNWKETKVLIRGIFYGHTSLNEPSSGVEGYVILGTQIVKIWYNTIKTCDYYLYCSVLSEKKNHQVLFANNPHGSYHFQTLM